MKVLFFFTIITMCFSAEAMERNLSIAVRDKKTALVIKLLQEGGHLDDVEDVASLPMTAFERALLSDDMVFVPMLLSHGVQVNAKNKNGCCALDRIQSEEMAQLLLDCGADRVPVDGQSTPLHTAAFMGKLHVIKALLTLISNSKVSDEETLVAEQLALATKMIRARDHNDETPLELARRVGAVGFGNREVIVPLLDGRHVHELEPLIRQNVKKVLELMLN